MTEAKHLYWLVKLKPQVRLGCIEPIDEAKVRELFPDMTEAIPQTRKEHVSDLWPGAK